MRVAASCFVPRHVIDNICTTVADGARHVKQHPDERHKLERTGEARMRPGSLGKSEDKPFDTGRLDRSNETPETPHYLFPTDGLTGICFFAAWATPVLYSYPNEPNKSRKSTRRARVTFWDNTIS